MPPADTSLWDLIGRGNELRGRALFGAAETVDLGRLADGSCLDCRREELAGAAVLLATTEQLTAALSLIELDGIAHRLVLCPPDVPLEHLSLIVETAAIDAVVSDGRVPASAMPDGVRLVTCRAQLAPAKPMRPGERSTEWILLTSGTTGVPKLVLHTLKTLTGAIKPSSVEPRYANPGSSPVWSTFYDIRRYGGLQIFLRAALSGGSLVLSSPAETTVDFLARAGRHGVTHISGTPSHWRRALMSAAANRMAPRYVRLSGEIADQAILNDLHRCYRDAGVGHAFASTEAGVAFDVNDGLAGFPADLIGREGAEVEMKIIDDTLRIRSSRTALRYLGGEAALRGGDGFVDTGDVIERRGERCYFIGRRGGIINVGGLKVYPEEVEAVINRHAAVQMSLVRARKNPFTGAVVTAEVVMRPELAGAPAGGRCAALESEIIAVCRRELSPHKVPATIRFVPSLSVGAAGKLARRGA